MVAYEPVWAIGKTASEAMQPADVEEMQIFVRKVLTEIFGRAVASVVPILYGGSVKPENARELMSSGGVAGFLVGSASAKAPSLVQIITEVCKKS